MASSNCSRGDQWRSPFPMNCVSIGAVTVKKLALKRLTKSDLTIFEWHFRNRNAGNQKSINLNADVFVNELYPAVPTVALTNGNEMPVSVSIFGPGVKTELALARKIIKGAAYKNWRLNGEFIFNPAGDPDRFNVLLPGDPPSWSLQEKLSPLLCGCFFLQLICRVMRGFSPG